MLQFLNPLMLWGLTAAAVPVVIHLLNRRRFKRQRWAAMEWLLQAVQKHKRRLRLESLLLLLLRTLAVLLLALALAKPHLSNSPIAVGATQQTHLFVVLDNSASMGARGGLRTAFEDATTTAASLVGEIGSDDPVTLIVTNDNASGVRATGRPARLFESRDHAKVRRTLAELRPAPARADLLESLKVLEELLPEGGGLQKRVAILTDLQRVTVDGPGGAGHVAEDGDEGPPPDEVRAFLQRIADKGAEVILIPAGRDVANVAVVSLRPEDERDIVQGAPAAFLAEVVNYSDRPQRVELRFLVDGDVQGAEAATWLELPPRPAGAAAPPGRSHRFVTRFDQDDVGIHTVEARIPTDAFPLDDTRSLAFEVRPRLKVLAVDGDPDPDSESGEVPETYWLTPALALTDGGPISVHSVHESEFLAMHALDDWDMVILANVRRPAPDDAARERLEAYVRRGGALLLTVGENTLPDEWNRTLWRDGHGLLPAPLVGASVRDEPWLQLDLGENRHPIMRDITDSANAVYFESPIQKGYMRVGDVDVQRGARVVLRYMDLRRSPALVERRFSKGRTLLLTTTVDEKWDGLAGSFLFPALLHETVYVLTARGNESINLLTFQPYQRAFPANFDEFELTYPDGTPAKPEVDEPPDGQSSVTFRGTTQLGVYRTQVNFKAPDILSPAPTPATGMFTVNLTRLESDLRRIHPEEIEARWDELVSVSADLGMAAKAMATREGGLHRSLLIAALLCLVCEVALARHIGRGRTRE